MTDATTIVPEIETARHRIKAVCRDLFLSARSKRDPRRVIAGNLFLAARESDPTHAPIWSIIDEQVERLKTQGGSHDRHRHQDRDT